MKHGLIVLSGLTLFCALGAGRAIASATDFCAANLTDVHAVAPSDAGAASYTYRLVAFNPGTHDVSMIADTDHGWFAWTVRGIQLTIAQRTIHVVSTQGPHDFHSPEMDLPFQAAQSETLGVTLPNVLRLRHVWVTSAGGRDCEPPSFGDGSLVEWKVGNVLAPSTQPVTWMKAVPATALFESVCAEPFVDSTVTKPVAPDLTENARATIDTSGPEVMIVATAVDARGKPIDAWPLAYDGNVMDFDRTSVAGARVSKYQGAISYCRPVPSYYQYNAWAWPD